MYETESLNRQRTNFILLVVIGPGGRADGWTGTPPPPPPSGREAGGEAGEREGWCKGYVGGARKTDFSSETRSTRRAASRPIVVRGGLLVRRGCLDPNNFTISGPPRNHLRRPQVRRSHMTFNILEICTKQV
jgi:hypothetical protein